MNYTKTIREYCLQNKGGLFNISKEHKEHFDMIPLKTYYKILNRLVDEKILIRQAHSVYFIVEPPKTKKSKDRVIEWYGSHGFGVVVGYKWYNEVGVTPYYDNTILIYSNRIDKNTLNIGRHHIEKVSIPNFNHNVCKIIRALELIEKCPTIIDLDPVKWGVVLEICLFDFNIFFFEEIIKNKKYQYSTICTLANKLSEMGDYDNKVIEVYKKWNSVKNEKVIIRKPFKPPFSND